MKYSYYSLVSTEPQTLISKRNTSCSKT